MRILFFYNSYLDRGGEETEIRALQQLLKKNGHTVISHEKHSSDIKNISDKLNALKNVFVNKEQHQNYIKLIQQTRPDVAIFQNIYPLIGPSAYSACFEEKIPIIQKINNYRLICPKTTLFRNGAICTLCTDKKFKYPNIKYGCYHNSRIASATISASLWLQQRNNIYKKIQFFLFPSEFSQKLHLTSLPISKKQSIIIPPFADWRPSSTNRKDGYFLYVGRLAEEKGIRNFIKAAESIPHVNFIIIGNGPLLDEIRSNIKRLTNIKLYSNMPRAKIKNYFKKALFTVMPSLWYDVMPNVIIESFSQGTGIIAPKIGPFDEVITNGKNGFLYPYNDQNALQLLITRLAQKKYLAKIVGHNALGTYGKNYTPGVYYKKISAILNSIAGHA